MELRYLKSRTIEPGAGFAKKGGGGVSENNRLSHFIRELRSARTVTVNMGGGGGSCHEGMFWFVGH